MRTIALALLAALAGCSSGVRLVAIPRQTIDWRPAPGLVSGMETSIQWGDPAGGPYQALIKFPAGAVVQPHFHRIDEFATVASGSVVFGQGDTIDESKGVEVSAGGYVTIPGGTAHWARCVKDAVVVRFAPGPRDLTPLKDGEKAPGGAPMKIVQAKDVPWEQSPGMVRGVMTALQYGDPAKGPYIILLKFPKDLPNPPHYHSADEIVTILSGRMITGEGRAVDEAAGKPVDAGGYFIIPGHTPHWGRATEDVVLTRLGNGPRDIFYFDKK